MSKHTRAASTRKKDPKNVAEPAIPPPISEVSKSNRSTAASKAWEVRRAKAAATQLASTQSGLQETQKVGSMNSLVAEASNSVVQSACLRAAAAPQTIQDRYKHLKPPSIVAEVMNEKETEYHHNPDETSIPRCCGDNSVYRKKSDSAEFGH
ncbi:uncharacterized protein EI90DRAFT_3124213 [Cantharellus anzutake]|uniref:uncharacterized protein n=1 Tax=Cantharellus anzutake TaxID=1750568 RepID=UPI0019084C8D|nr:uncharacterized protein EI90DRAFT_3124213 [Cantharellus anzutake]KAF8330559.1 hypothetical protein EI90DRAFT_3124213 [Cantharellus anzutake]